MNRIITFSPIYLSMRSPYFSPPLQGGLGGYQAHHVHNDEVSEHYRSKDRALNYGQVT
jgi:hypothetical protein